MTLRGYMQNNITDKLKALSDPTRLKIVEMLGSGKLCACKILDNFSMTQPTLSYHMKILADCGLVDVEKDWKWSYYSLNHDAIEEIIVFFNTLKEYL